MVSAPDLDLIPTGIVSCDRDGHVLYANATILEWLECGNFEDLAGKPFYTLLTPAGRIYFETHIRPMLMLEGRCDEISLELLAHSKTRRQIYLSGKVEYGPDDAITALNLVCFNGSQRHKYEQELLAQRRNAEAYEAIIKASPDAIINIGADLTIHSWNNAAEELLGYTAAEALGESAHPLIVSDDLLGEVHDLMEEVAKGKPVRVETARLHKDGGSVPVELSIAAMADERGNFSGTAGVLRDIKERKKQEELIETLNREVVHRSKNLLSVVQGIASMTARFSDPKQFVGTFSQRLNSLATNLSLLVERNWSSVEMRDLVEQQLSHLGEDVASRIDIEGPDFRIAPSAAEALGMAIFELSTNAVKYGALSNERGRIAIAWTIENSPEKKLILRWVEDGVQGLFPPKETGFGSSLTGKLLESATSGVTESDYRNTGLRWTFAADVSDVT